MTMLTLGVAEDEREHGVGANCLWPRTMIATAAVQNLLGGDAAMAVTARRRSSPTRRRRSSSGTRARRRNTFIDDEVLAEEGVTDLGRTAGTDGDLALDIFVDGWPAGSRA